jgi:hypothetical protein
MFPLWGLGGVLNGCSFKPQVMKFLFTTLLCFSFIILTTAQDTRTLRQTLNWSEKPMQHNLNPKNVREMAHFKGAVYSNHDAPTLPVFTHRFPLNGDGRLSANINILNTTPLSIKADIDHEKLTENIDIQAFVTQERNMYWGNITFTPLRKTGSSLEKIIEFELNINFTPQIKVAVRGPLGARESVLKDGDIYKFAIKESGIHKLDYDFLKNQLKIANIDQIDPRTIKIYGNGGGMLPEANNVERLDDLIENALLIQGEEDGKFDAADVIVFNAVGPDKWIFDKSTKLFNRPKNIYSNESYYFIKISSGNGLRVAPQPSLASTPYTTNTFNDFIRFEEDKINLLHSARCQCTQGSGKLWCGDTYTNSLPERTYSDKFNFPNIVSSEPANIQVDFVGRSLSLSNFNVMVAGKAFTKNVFSADEDVVEGVLANLSSINETFTPTADNLEVKVSYPAQGGNEGWLDFIQINARRRLQLVGSQMAFRDINTLGKTGASYQLAGATANVLIWDITNAQKPKNQQFTLSGNALSFGANTEGVLKEYVAFDKNNISLKPTVVGKISNQNLHAIDNIDLLIIYHKEFEKATQTLAEQRKKQGLSVTLAEIGQVYNEFSSGALDPTAIRDFARHLHQRNTRFKYMLLMGDGSFDYKRIYPLGNLQASDFIPPYETDRSLHGLYAFPSDDYYALLSDNEGLNLEGDLDIAVGRIVAKTEAEANGVVNKILNYEDPKNFGDWRNRALFMADDEDGNLHQDSADDIADNVVSNNRNYNVEKLYVDAFRQEVSAGGTRVPALNDAIYQNQFKGVSTMCYLGHGGPKRLAQEAVITREDMDAWRNFDKLPIFVTATCSFCGYDNPKEDAAGERALLNENGGMVALLSTVRLVFASSNATLTSAVFDTIFKKVNFRAQTIGDVIVAAKNSSRTGENGNKFTLIGDPSMRIAVPRYNIATTKINNKITDTVRALQKVTIEGTILGDNGQILTNFNGTLYPTIYDKVQTLRTLGQDNGSSPTDFTVQRNVLFKGAATITNGVWKFSFVVPKDIDYAFGNGKISYYATNNITDAAGNFENFIIGGTDPSVAQDNKPPLVQVFMNDDNFAFGGMTDPNPTIYAKLSDDNGINVSGISIGHDLSGVLDESKNSLQLNNFYEAVKDDPSKGVVRYPLSKLSIGRHKITVKAWDVANNSGEGYTEFVVNSDAKAALAHVLNYPNPFTTKTKFQFEHNMVGQQLQVRVNIFSVSGRLVKTIDQSIDAEGYRVSDIGWDGKDDYGDNLARGVYLYKVKITGKDIKGKKIGAESEFEKLVILK